MLRRGEEKIPLAVYKLKTYLAVFWLTFQPKDGWFSWLLFYHCMFIRHPLKLECLSQHGGKFRKLYLEAQSNSESTFGVLHQMLEFFISQVKVDTSRHRIYFRWHYVLISPFAFLIAFCSSEFFLLPSPAQTARAAVLSHCWSSFSQKAPEGHLVQPPAPARTKCSIRAGWWAPFSQQSVKIYSSRDWLQPDAVQFSCWNLPFFRSRGIFSHRNLRLFSSVFTLQHGADPVSSVTTL